MEYNNWFCEKFKRKNYSQHGEEGVIDELFKRLDITEGYIVDVGASNGKWNSNCYETLEKGFKFLAIEQNESMRKLLKEISEEYPIMIEGVISIDEDVENNLDSLLKKNNFPEEFELLNIDIDSWDYFVWKGLKKYSPKIVIIEIEPRYDLDKEYLPNKNIEYDKTRRPSNQASFKTMLELGKIKGYSLVGCLSCNMFFVRDDLKDKLKIQDILDEPDRNFDRFWTTRYCK